MRLIFLWSFALVLMTARIGAAEDVLSSLRLAHPRLLLTNEQLAADVAAARTDPLRARQHARIIAVAEAQLTVPLAEHVLIGPRLLDQSRKVLGCVLTEAMAFRLTGDHRYAERAKQEMLHAAAFTDWNPSHFLDVAEMATGLALGYDWLYDQLTLEERATIKQAILTKALAFARPAYAQAYPKREAFPFVGNNLRNNWNQVCNGGFVLAALALADEEPALAREVIAGMRKTLPLAMEAYQPDGAYPEGPVYWGYGTRYNVILLAALESALGRDFGLSQMPAFERTSLFWVYVQSPTGLSFNYADGGTSLGADIAPSWLGRHFHQPLTLALNRARLAALLNNPTPPREENDRFLALHAVWFPEDQTQYETDLPPLDANFDGASKIALFRSAWNDPRALWTGLKAGSNRVNHGHLDLGSFMLDADGERWAVDLGPDDYNLPGYWESATVKSPRWQYYRLNNFSHNTLTPGETLQLPAADAAVIAYRSTRARAFAVTDLTSAYPAAAKKILRGVVLLDRARVLVQDEITALKPGIPLHWRMLTGADVQMETDRRIVLTQNGRTLRLELISPANAVFAAHRATPPTAAENQNKGITVLEAVVPTAGTASDCRLAVLLTPVGEKWPKLPSPIIESLTLWK